MACVECKDAWTWVAVYDDTTAIYECDATGQHKSFTEVDTQRVRQLRWLPLYSNLQQIILDVGDGGIPVLFRQRMIIFDMDSGNVPHKTAHCLGWTDESGNGRYTFVFEDGTVLVSSNLNAATDWIDKL